MLVAFNAFAENIVRPVNEFERLLSMETNTIVAPSLLVYITPPTVRIVSALGARVTGIEVIGDELLLACNTMANSGRYDAQPIDAGYRTLLPIPTSVLESRPPPVRITVSGAQVEDKVFGGVPLAGYREPRLVVKSTKSNTLSVFEYDLSLPLQQAWRETEKVGIGRNVVELRGFGNAVVSFKLEEPDPKALIHIDLL